MKRIFSFSKIKPTINLFLKGLLMGAADIVPGVSGGTIAFIVGIYERLLTAISNVLPITKSIFQTRTIQNTKAQIKNLDWQFLIPLGSGVVVSFLSLSSLMTHLLTNYSGPTFAFFTGLILASAGILITHARTHKLKQFILVILGFIVAYLITSLTATALPSTLPVVFISGIIAICAMLLPGISGSYLLVVLGQYQFIITAIHEKNLKIISTFGVGAIIGLLSIAKLLNHLFKKFHDNMIYILTGVMLGALKAPILNITQSSIALPQTILFIILGIIPIISISFLRRQKSNS